MIREVQKWSGGCPFFALKKHRDEWAQQIKSSRDFGPLQARGVTDSVAHRAVAHLVMCLNVAKKAMLRQRMSWPAMDPASVTGVDAVINKSALQRFGQLFERAEVRIIALPLVARSGR